MAKSTGILTPLKYNLNQLLFHNSSYDGLVCSLCKYGDINDIEVIENHYSWLKENGGHNYENHNSIVTLTNLVSAESDYGLQMFNLLKEMYSEHIITIDMNNLSMFNQRNQDELMCYWLTSDCENITFDMLLFEVESFEFFHYDLYNLWGNTLKHPLISTAPHQFIPVYYGFSNWNMLVKPEWLAETGILDKEYIKSLNNNKSIIWLNH